MPRLSLVPRSNHLIRDSLSDFLLSKRSALLSPRTIGYYSESLLPFVAFLEAEGVSDPPQIEARHIREYLAERAKRTPPASRRG